MFSLLMAIILLASAQPAPVAPVIDMEPAVSADGSLAFASNRSGGFDIFTVDAEGGGIRQITEGGGKDTPAWSPDGALLAFSWDRNGDADLFVVPREGGAPVQITGGSGSDLHPFFSPDGRQIVFTRYESERLFVMIVDAEGGAPRRLTAGANASYGSLSPDGLSLLYWREFDGNAEVVIADAHGRGERRLTHNMNFDGWPSWSPDGRMIAFSRDNGVSADIVVLELASGAEQVLTSGPGRRISHVWTAPCWQGKSLITLGGRCAHVSGLLMQREHRWPSCYPLTRSRSKARAQRRSGIDGFVWSPVRPVLHDFVIALSNPCARRDGTRVRYAACN